jgi:Ftsk/SpoIIIE family protein
MSSKSSEKKRKKKLQRYYKNGKNVYPYAKTSRILWGSGFTVTIFVGLIVVSQLILFLLQKLALKIQELVGIDSKLGTNLQNFIQIELPLGGILKALLAVLLFIAVTYLVTIALRHHEGELQPFKDDRIARKLKSQVIKKAEWNKIEYDDNGKPKLTKKEQEARRIATSMNIDIHTRKEVNGNDFLTIAIVTIFIPKGTLDSVVEILKKNYLKPLSLKLSSVAQSLGTALTFSDQQPDPDEQSIYFKAEEKVTEKYVYKIEKAQALIKQLTESSLREKEYDTEIVTKGTLSYNLSILLDEEVAKTIQEQRIKANEETENLSKSLETFIASHEDLNLQFEEVKATTSIARFIYSVPIGAKLASPETIQKNLENDLRIKNTIVSNEAGKIIISIPLKNTVMADAYSGFKAFLDRPKPHNKLDMFIGIDVNGEPVVRDLTTAPHILLSGGSGSGKSVGINQFVASLMLENTPADVKFVLVDPKTTEFQLWENCPFLYTDIITDMDKASASFNALWTEMERRNALMAKVKVRNLASYNAKVGKEKKEPYIFLVVDELSYLMKTHGDEIERAIEALGEKARSAGIHVMLATQSPRADVVKGKIKANMMTGISYRVKTSLESDIALDESGAERLKGKGDTLMKWNEDGETIRLQGTFLTDDNLNSIMKAVEAKYTDKEYYERVPLEVFEEDFVEAKNLGDVSKGSVYRYAIKHQNSQVIDEDVEEQEVVVPVLEEPKGTPAIASAQPYETKSVHKESFEDYRKRYEEKNALTALELDDILSTRNSKLKALVKQMELDREKEQEQEKDTPKLDHEVEEAIEERVSHNEPEPTTPVDKEAIANELYPDEPTPTEEVKKDNSILPKPIPKDWNFRKTGNKGKM